MINKICVDCGLDNTKNDESYVMGKSSCDNRPLSHVHELGQNSYEEKTLRKDVRQDMKRQEKQQNTTNQDIQRVKKRIGIIFGIAFVAISIFGSALPSIVKEFKREEGLMENTWDNGVDEGYTYEYNPYEYVTRELSSEGEDYEISLGDGVYKCGVHIPEGTYRMDVESGDGSLTVENEANGISLNYTLGDNSADGAIIQEEDIRLYKGAILTLAGDVAVRFTTANGQMDLTGMDNPNTEIKSFTTSFTAGKDISAGVYDVHCDSGSGIFEYYINKGDYDSYQGILVGDEESSFPQDFKNIVLPEGIEVTLNARDMKVTLTPSTVIESEDYAGFYGN